MLSALLISASLPGVTSFAAETVKTEKVALKIETIATGLDHPWSVEVLPDGSYIVSERSGSLRLIRNGIVGAPIDGVPKVFHRGQGGLLDVAISPDFAQSRIIYFTASTSAKDGSGTEVFRARLADDGRELSEVRSIFKMRPFTSGNIQYGARIAVAPDRTLFVSLGDRGDRDRSQDWNDDAGAIIHITADGAIASDNPFKDNGKALPEIWSKGHRNPQGIAFDSADGSLYTAEHGARRGDEINLIKPGRNYGWPVITYGVDYSGAKIGEGTKKAGLEQPIHYWDPSIAPGALAVYRGKMFPEWQGDLLVAALKFQLLSRLHRNGDGTFTEERMLANKYGRLRDIVVAPDGALLVVTDESNGALLRIARAQE